MERIRASVHEVSDLAVPKGLTWTAFSTFVPPFSLSLLLPPLQQIVVLALPHGLALPAALERGRLGRKVGGELDHARLRGRETEGEDSH